MNIVKVNSTIDNKDNMGALLLTLKLHVLAVKNLILCTNSIAEETQW